MEYQKCELPHCHILLFLSAQDQIQDSEQVDNYIQAEFSDSELDSDDHLTELIEELIMHRLCGEWNPSSSCMKSNKYGCSVCFKHYSKPLQPEIIVHENGYSLYCCGADGHKVTKQVNEVKMTMGNEWVVLYSPFLLCKYQTHINVKVVKTV